MTDKKSIQEHIDQAMIREGGYPFQRRSLTYMQWYIWFIAATGKLFEGMILIITGIMLPIIEMNLHLTLIQTSLIPSTILFGILVGALSLGNFADIFGRKKIFFIEMLILAMALISVFFAYSFLMLLGCFFFMGVALGGDYPIANIIISEQFPSMNRGRMVLSAFAFQAIGAALGAFIAYLFLSEYGSISIVGWRDIYLVMAIPVFLVFIARLFILETAHWLHIKGKTKKAELSLNQLLGYKVSLDPADPDIILNQSKERKSIFMMAKLFTKPHIKATCLASLPWFIQDIATYGIGVFTPVVLGVIFLHPQKTHTISSLMYNELRASRGTFYIDLFLLVGISCAIFLVEKISRIKLQIVGFLGCALGLLIAALSQVVAGNLTITLVFVGFIIFNFMVNLGPNPITYLIAGEVFPTDIRGTGAGFAATCAKIGACLTTFFFPILLKDIGLFYLLLILVFSSVLGAFLTYLLRIETRSKNLELI